MMKIISLPISEGAILKPRSKFNFIAQEIEGKIGLLVFCGAILGDSINQSQLGITPGYLPIIPEECYAGVGKMGRLS